MNKTLPLLLSATLTCVSHGAVTSFSDNFDDYDPESNIPSPWSFSNSAGAATQKISTISGSNRGYSLSLTSNASNYGVVSAGSGSDFVVSVQFRMDSLAAGSNSSATINHSLNALASATLGTGYRLNYVPAYSTSSIQNAGLLVLAETGGTGLAGTLNSTSTHFLTAADIGASGKFYTLQLTGTYSGGVLTLNGVLLDGATVLLSVSGTDSTIQTGSYFGMRFASNSSQNTGTVTYDNFSVLAVPEPATAGLAGIGLMGMLLRRRQR